MMEGRMDGWVEGWLDDGRMDGWVGGRMDEWMDGWWMDGSTKEGTSRSRMDFSAPCRVQIHSDVNPPCSSI